MGCYVNPANETKESFLKREGIAVNNPSWLSKPKNTLPVVLMDNGSFSAAGIAYSERELKEFTRPDDYRLKTFFYVDIQKLCSVSNVHEYINIER